jgi:hypothetical protein
MARLQAVAVGIEDGCVCRATDHPLQADRRRFMPLIVCIRTPASTNQILFFVLASNLAADYPARQGATCFFEGCAVCRRTTRLPPSQTVLAYENFAEEAKENVLEYRAYRICFPNARPARLSFAVRRTSHGQLLAIE